MKLLLWLLLHLIQISITDATHVPVSAPTPTYVTMSTPTGDITGIEEEFELNITEPSTYTVQKFRGIPYAESPTGNLRFMKPVPKSSFNTAFDGTEEGPVCHQLRTSTQYIQSEDCLRLNIYVPITTDSEGNLKPVMIWIHGGGFVKGDANSYDGRALSAIGDVVVVTVSYRLNYFGFYTTSDDTSPGNYGLWDQHLAIKWVRSNIKAFGGDPDQITLFGGSSGASSVIYQSFYPGNKGLFRNAIAQSGSITSPWAFKDKQTSAKLSSTELGYMAGCPKEPPMALTHCLQQLPIDVLLDEINNMNEHVIGPVFDNEFILHHPSSLLSNNMLEDPAVQMFHSVNLLMGYNTAEGSVDFLNWASLTNGYSQALDELVIPKDVYEYNFIPHYIELYFEINSTLLALEQMTQITQMTQMTQMTQHEYTDWSNPLDNNKRFLKLMDLAADCYVTVPTVQTALKHEKENPYFLEHRSTYAYEFAVLPANMVNQRPAPLQCPTMAAHGDEITFVFGKELKKTCENENLVAECNVYLAMLNMWTNFAKTGNPNTPKDVTSYINTEWQQFSTGTPTQMGYLRITTDMSSDSMKTNMRARANNFWTQVLPAVMELDYMLYHYDAET